MKTSDFLRDLAKRIDNKKIDCVFLYCDTIPENADTIEACCNEGYEVRVEFYFRKPQHKH